MICKIFISAAPFKKIYIYIYVVSTYGWVLQSEAVKRKMVADEREEIARRPGSNLGATNSEAMENTHFIHDKQVLTSVNELNILAVSLSPALTHTPCMQHAH